MSYGSRGGRAETRRIQVGPAGVAYGLPFQSSYIILRPQGGTARLYWNERDWKADADGTSETFDRYVALNSGAYPGEFRARVAVTHLYLRGDATVEATVISQG